METRGKVDSDDGAAPENSGFAILDRIAGICGLRASVHGKIEGGWWNGQNCLLTKAPSKKHGIGRDPFGFANFTVTDSIGRPLLIVYIIYTKNGQIRTMTCNRDGLNQEISAILQEILDHFSFRF